MALSVRLLTLSEMDIVIDYFLESTPEHLEMMGVDPSRLPTRETWQKDAARDDARPLAERQRLAVLWEREGKPTGFSTVNKIVFGKHAYMHLHVLDPADRASGIGVECVKKSVALYFEILKLERLFCEPNAFNIAPNRTVQKAGFSYVKTYMTAPGAINFHQPVTRWVLER